MKRVTALVMAAAMTAGMLAGCSSAPASDAPAQEPASQGEASSQQPGEITTEPVTLRFMWWGGDERHEATLKVIEQFEELYPNVTIEAEYGGNEGYQDKLVTQLYGGNAADIIQTDPAWLPDIVRNGDFFVDLNEYSDYFDTTTFDKGLIDSFGMYDGKLLGVTTGSGSMALVYNKLLVDEIGLDLSIADKDWEGLIELGKQVQAYDPNMYLMNIDTQTVARAFVGIYLMQLTGQPMVIEETGEITFTQEQLVEVLDLIQRMYKSGTFQPASQSAPYYNNIATNPAWIEGKLVGGYNYASNILNDINAYTAEAEWIVDDVPMPDDRKNDGIAATPFQVITVSNTCEHPEVAAKFLDYFFNNEEAILTLNTVRGVPSQQNSRDILQANDMINPIVGEATEMAAAHNGLKTHGILTSVAMWDVLIEMVERTAYEDAPLEQIAADAMKGIQQVIDDSGRY